MHAAVIPADILDNLFAAIDAKDTERFVEFIAEDGEFRFGSAPPVRGRASIATAVQAFFDSIESLSHRVTRVLKDGDTLACEGEVCYQRHDGSEIVLPFANVFEFEGPLISGYRIYIDINPLYA